MKLRKCIKIGKDYAEKKENYCLTLGIQEGSAPTIIGLLTQNLSRKDM